MRNRAIVALLLALLFSATASALTLPSCPSNQVCLFSGFKLEQIKTTPVGTTFSTTGFSCPVNAPVTGPFGATYKNLNNEDRVRQGVEIRLPEGTDVRAAAGGKVIASGRTDLLGYGRYVTIRHSTNPTVETTYGYLQVGPNPVEGSDVKKGDIIGKSGKSEANAFPSFYFELRRAGIPQRDVESICKTAAPATTAAAIGAVDCREFTLNPVPDSWSVVPGGRFGSPRSYPGGHSGFDYGGFACGTPIKAVWPGKVQYFKNTGRGYGNEVSIRTSCVDGSERIVSYDHLQGFNAAVLSKGSVQAGEVIAYLGNTGGDYECHLHVNLFAPPFRIQNGLSSGNVLNPETVVKGGLQGHLA